jgi:rubredoxin
MKDNEYKCANCHNVYEKGWSDEESLAEAESNFGKHPKDWKLAAVVICDDCYELMKPENNPELVSKIKREL